MRRLAVILACLGPTIAQAGWGPSWTNGSIWAHQRVARDLRAAVDERCQWAGGTNTTITAPTIWMSWYWVGRVDAAIASLAPAFCNLSLTNAAGHYNRTNEVPPMLTFTGVLHQAGITNAAGYPVFRRDATNFTIWPRLADLRQRRDALARLKWTRILIPYNSTYREAKDGLAWSGTTSGPSSAAWADLYRGASNNYATAAWSWTGVLAQRQAFASVTPYVGTRTVTLYSLAGKMSVPVQAAWTNWTRTADVYANVLSYYYEGDDYDAAGDGHLRETRYDGADTDGTLPNFTAWTNRPGYLGPSWHRSIAAASGTVWNSYWLGDTNGVRPTMPTYVAGTGGTNDVARGYHFTLISPAAWNVTTEDANFGRYTVMKWEARYP